MIDKNTPTPWGVTQDYAGTEPFPIQVKNAQGKAMILCRDLQVASDVCRAVNAHDQLVGALQEMLSIHGAKLDELSSEQILEIIQAALSTLRLARKETS